jgi:hypothetical protein
LHVFLEPYQQMLQNGGKPIKRILAEIPRGIGNVLETIIFPDSVNLVTRLSKI